MHQPRDENGQFVSIGTLFERERQEHMRDHEAERIIARETAQRLEREVEQTALRLERLVEETALRLEKAVQTALVAVGETARVHSEAHNREHFAHERIHSVEKEQVNEARAVINNRLSQMNEFRGALEDQSGKMVSRELFDALSDKVSEVQRRMAFYAGGAAVTGAVIALVVRLIGAGG